MGIEGKKLNEFDCMIVVWLTILMHAVWTFFVLVDVLFSLSVRDW